MAKNLKENLPRLSRIDYFRLHSDDFFGAVFQGIDQELGEGQQRRKRWARLNPHQQGLYAWWCFWGELWNAGLTQFFYNQTDILVPAIERLMKASGNTQMARLLNQGTRIYRKHKKEFKDKNPFGKD